MAQGRKARPQGWHPEDVKAELRKRGYTLSDLGRACGHAQNDTPRKVFTAPWPAMEKMIAGILKVHPAMIWPERYHRDGTPKGNGIRKTYRNTPVPGNGKARGAA